MVLLESVCTALIACAFNNVNVLIDITGRRADVLDKAAKTYNVRQGAGELIPIVCDVTKKEDIESNCLCFVPGD